jgi:SPX domain protein involved in polyphosphate accumulation
LSKVKYRHELKFILSPAYAEILKHRLAMIMDVDENSANEDNTYFIRSLYFDDCQDSAYYEKIDGVEYRKKYRIRLYNNNCSFIRLECKYKHENKTSKDQILIDKSICDKIINGNIEELNIDKANLLTKFVVEYRTRNLRPSIIVDYKRLAYTYPVSDVRVTFDSKIRSGRYNYNLYDKDLDTYKVIDDIEVVLEVKFNEILPEQIAIVLSTVPMIRQAFSKFAVCRSIK